MKKLMIVPVLALGLLFTANATAQEARLAEKETAMLTVEKAEQQEKSFTKIEASQLPDAVRTAVARDFEGATIAEAHVSEDRTTYKLVVNVGDERKTLYADANGNWKKK